MENIFQEFNATDYSNWLKKIETDLKGKPLDTLESKPEADLSIVAYHHPENDIRPLNFSRISADNTWKIRHFFKGKEKETNANILAELNEGVNAIGLEVDHTTNFNELTKGVLFEHIQTDITLKDKAAITTLQNTPNTILNFDVIGQSLSKGKWINSLTDFDAFFKGSSAIKKTWVSGYQYGEAGASTVQELAFTLAHLNEYVQSLFDDKVSLNEINESLVVELSVNDNYFVNIAKFRVFRSLAKLLFEGYDTKHDFISPTIYAKTNIRHLAKNDANNNPLRETTQAMSAIIGGCDVLTIQYGEDENYSIGSEQEQKRFRRISRNIQLILKEEAYLDKVIDPGAGSYYLEQLSSQILEKSWNLFLEIENNGGLIKAIKENTIQTKIQANRKALIDQMISNKNTFLGVNKHPNATEEWIEPIEPNKTSNGDFEALTPFNLEAYFSKPTAK